jgi:hypothetical protein
MKYDVTTKYKIHGSNFTFHNTSSSYNGRHNRDFQNSSKNSIGCVCVCTYMHIYRQMCRVYLIYLWSTSVQVWSQCESIFIMYVQTSMYLLIYFVCIHTVLCAINIINIDSTSPEYTIMERERERALSVLHNIIL